MSEKRTVVVTGGNRGIGRQVVKELAERGWTVFLGARSREKGEKAAQNLEGDVRVLELDVADEESVARAAKKVGEDAGKLDALVNNAGIFEDEGRSILDVTSDLLLATLQTNTFGPLAVSRAFWELLKTGSGGRIVNVSSGLGQLHEMEDEKPAYAISKTALNALTRQLAGAGHAAGIAVNSVCPGWVRTDMGGENAARSVEEGADTIVWLVTEAPADLSGKFLRDREEIEW